MVLNKKILKAIKEDDLKTIQLLFNSFNSSDSEFHAHYVLYCCGFGSLICLKILLSSFKGHVLSVSFNNKECLVHIVNRKRLDLLKYFLTFDVAPSFNNNEPLYMSFDNKANDIFSFLFKDKRVKEVFKINLEEAMYMSSTTDFQQKTYLNRVDTLIKMKDHFKCLNI